MSQHNTILGTKAHQLDRSEDISIICSDFARSSKEGNDVLFQKYDDVGTGRALEWNGLHPPGKIVSGHMDPTMATTRSL
jgi:hypothetical protein